jgi:hypothetical protein
LLHSKQQTNFSCTPPLRFCNEVSLNRGKTLIAKILKSAEHIEEQQKAEKINDSQFAFEFYFFDDLRRRPISVSCSLISSLD